MFYRAYLFSVFCFALQIALWIVVGTSEAALSVRKCVADGDPKSIQSCTEAIQLQELSCVDLAVAYHFRGLAHIKSSQPKNALEDLNKSIYFNSLYADAYKTRGELHNQLGQKQLADKDLSLAEELSSEAEAAYTSSYWEKYMHSEYDQAITLANDAIARNPKLGYAYQVRGDAYYQNSHYRLAIVNFEMALSLIPSTDTWFKDIEGHLKYSKKNLKYEKAQEDPAWFKSCNLPPAPEDTRSTVEITVAGNVGVDIENLKPSKIETEQPPIQPTEKDNRISRGNRLALVIGINEYENLDKLQNAVGDAQSISDALSQMGFKVTKVLNEGVDALTDEIDVFENAIQQNDEVVFYYSGHGVQFDGENYLLPADFKKTNMKNIKRKSIILRDTLNDLNARNPKILVSIIDACRNNPLGEDGTKGFGGTKGLAPVGMKKGKYILLFAADYGEEALDRLGDDDPIETSLFTRVLLKQLEIKGKTFLDIEEDVTEEVTTLAEQIDLSQHPAVEVHGKVSKYVLNP